jgi:hypothetical protein
MMNSRQVDKCGSGDPHYSRSGQTEEDFFKVSKKCQGTTLQAAKKVVHQKVLYQGASLLAPQAEQDE